MIYGEALFGYVDVVPGWFCVATRFHHVCLVPVFPFQSYVVLGEEGWVLEGSYQGVPIGRDPRSVKLAYLEGLATLPAVVGGAMALLVTVLNRGPTLTTGVGLGLLVLGLGGMWLLRRTPRLASYERALELAKRIKLRPEHQVLLDVSFGRLGQEEAQAKIAAIMAEREVKAAAQQANRQAAADARLEARAQAKGVTADELKAHDAALKAKAPKRSRRPG